MKLGLVIAFALFTQLLSQKQYMLSVFMLGYNINTANDVSNPSDTAKELPKNGVVRFRAIIFKSLQNAPFKEVYDYDEVDWGAHFAVDFDLPFLDLKKDFLKMKFNDFSLKCKIDKKLEDTQGKVFKTIGNKNFKLKVFGVDMETKDTHVGSLITDYDITKNVYLSVLNSDFKIYLLSKNEVLPGSILNIKVSPNFIHRQPCMSTVKKSKFKIQSLPKKKIPNSDIPPWNDAKYKIETMLVEYDGKIKYFSNFKVKAENKIANVFLVVNSIPIRRHYDTLSFREFDITYDFPYLVKPISDEGLKNSPEPFTAEKAIWSDLTKPNSDLNITYENKNLISQRLNLDEAISLTLHFECFNLDIFTEETTQSKNILV